jgi:peptidoglycan/xylan/chitin deacetylase (PgdA/CDA1 family)
MSARPRTTILMFHRLGETLDPEEGDYAIPIPVFEQQLRWLAAGGGAVVSLEQLAAEGRPDRSVVLTFDDGCDSDASVAAVLLRELGFPATFFVCPELVGKPGHLGWEQLRSIAAQGFRVGSHGLDHSLFAELGAAELRRQLVESKRTLERRLEREVDAISLPGGIGGLRALLAAHEAGYRLVLGSRPGLVEGVAAPADILPRIPIRRGHGLSGFQAAVEQELAFRMRLKLRHGATSLARALMGAGAYRALRAIWLRRSAAFPRG